MVSQGHIHGFPSYPSYSFLLVLVNWVESNVSAHFLSVAWPRHDCSCCLQSISPSSALFRVGFSIHVPLLECQERLVSFSQCITNLT